MIFKIKFLLTVSVLVYCNSLNEEYAEKVTNWLVKVNNQFREYNRKSAELTWNFIAVGNKSLIDNGPNVGGNRIDWRSTVCEVLSAIKLTNLTERRMQYLLCRDPTYTHEQSSILSEMMDDMSEAYSTSEVCIPEALRHISPSGKKCLTVEPDLEKLLTNQNLSSSELLWVWKAWHDTIAPKIKSIYPEFVEVLNEGAVANGYNDIGEVWREELEMDNLEETVMKLYNEIKPLYAMLHAVVRHKLVEKYGTKIVDPTGSIPIHLLGNMWGQDWSSLIEILIPKKNYLNLDENIAQKNWTVKDMVLIAEDMYSSLGLPRMTDKFWNYSKFEEKDKNVTMCHGTAANMFADNDFRILLCASLNMEDFYIIHHEMGHIQYYMAYQKQPALFQEGANSAFQESIGDTIMFGVLTPQHLHRLGLISDNQLLDKHLDQTLLLRHALSKLPQIPFALLIDLYRWDIFRGKIKPEFYNSAYWLLNKKLRGIAPPEPRDERFFDAGSKFHVPDNTPYIRYFLSTILQMEMFKGMCEVTVFGKLKNEESKIPFPLHRCDIYGSKKAGEKLKKMMGLGCSKPWSKALKVLTGKKYITTTPLQEFYKPVSEWLKNYITKNNIHVGW